MSDRRPRGEDGKLAALARISSSGEAGRARHARAADVTLGAVRRLDSGAGPDRHPAAHRTDAHPRDAHPRDAHPRDARPVEDPAPKASRARARRDGVAANARLTGSTAAVLLVLLAVEGLTILQIRPLLNVHVFVGMLLIPPVLVKIGSTTWRFVKYYRGDPEYRRKGPPAPILRLLGPIVVVLTGVVLASGVALLVVSPAWRTQLLFVHKASFVLWFVAMTVHVLGHLLETAKLAPRDWYWRTRRQVAGASLRQWLLALSIVLGLVIGAVTLPAVGVWPSGSHQPASGVHRP